MGVSVALGYAGPCVATPPPALSSFQFVLLQLIIAKFFALQCSAVVAVLPINTLRVTLQPFLPDTTWQPLINIPPLGLATDT